MRPAELPRAAVALPRSAKKGPTRGQGSSLARPAWAVAEFGRRGRCSDEKGPAITGCSDGKRRETDESITLLVAKAWLLYQIYMQLNTTNYNLESTKLRLTKKPNVVRLHWLWILARLE